MANFIGNIHPTVSAKFPNEKQTTYNNSGNRFLPLAFANRRKAEVRKFLLFLIMLMMGVSGAWA